MGELGLIDVLDDRELIAPPVLQNVHTIFLISAGRGDIDKATIGLLFAIYALILIFYSSLAFLLRLVSFYA